MLSDRFHVAVVACDLAGDLVPLSKAEWCELAVGAPRCANPDAQAV